MVLQRLSQLLRMLLLLQPYQQYTSTVHCLVVQHTT
jgi:hypothetical protein